MSGRKGIAIQLETHLIKKLDDQDLPRNDIINTALEMYLTKETPKESAFIKIEEETKPSAIMSEDLYNEIYSSLYNTEITPLKNQLVQQRELIDTLKDELKEYRNDKSFLKQQIEHLFEQPPKKLSRFNRKRQKEEIKRLQDPVDKEGS
ncbi:MAG: hypothetical protein V1769_07145 [Thermoplasmatota archaeon]